MDVQQQIKCLQQQRLSWRELPFTEKLQLLQNFRARIYAAADEWVELSCQQKRIDFNSNLAAEEYLAGPYCILRTTRLLANQYRQLSKTSTLLKPKLIARIPQLKFRVTPTDKYDYLYLPGVKAEVWCQLGVALDGINKNPLPQKNTVALVLGAGNASAIPVLDLIHQLFNENNTVILKLSPVNAYLRPLLEKVFADFIAKQFVRIVECDLQATQAIMNDPAVGHIHITGSVTTFNKIKASLTEQNKTLTGELGNISPVIVVPGEWSQHDINYHADAIVSSLTNNASYNCNAPRLLVLWRGWQHRVALVYQAKIT